MTLAFLVFDPFWVLILGLLSPEPPKTIPFLIIV